LEDLKPNCTAPTWSSFQAFIIPDTIPATVISYGPFSPSYQQTIGGPETKFALLQHEFIPSIYHPTYHATVISCGPFFLKSPTNHI